MDNTTSKTTNRHLTLESLLDSPGLTPSPLSEPVAGSPVPDGISRNSRVNGNSKTDSSPVACATNVYEQKHSAPQMSEAQRLSLLRDHCIELLFLLRNQDTNGYFLSFAPKTGAKTTAPYGLLDLEKKLLSQGYKSLVDFKSDVFEMFSVALKHYSTESIPHNETKRLMNTVSDWFNSLPSNALELLNSQPTVTVTDVPIHAKDGSILKSEVPTETYLNILNPDNCGFLGRSERIRPLGEEVGQLRSGLYLLPNGGYREDRRNKIIPYTYLDYGPFYSFAPHYDSGASHCTPEAHQLVLGTAWLPARTAFLTPSDSDTQTDAPSADAIDQVLNSEPVRSALAIGDTQLAVTLAVVELENRQSAKLAEEIDAILPGPEVADECVFSMCLANALTKRVQSTESAQSTVKQINGNLPKYCDQNVDLDHESDDSCPPEDSCTPEDSLDHKLSESASDLITLYQTQYRRLGDTSQTCVMAGLNVAPSSTETAIAHRLVGRLVDLSKHARPRDLVHPYAVRRAMGLRPDIAPLPDEVTPTEDKNSPEVAVDTSV